MQADLKYTCPFISDRFTLTTINLLETADLGKTLHIFEASTGTLQVLLLILEESPL